MTDVTHTISEKIQSVWDSIINLPSQIGDWIYNLFVPDFQSIESTFNDGVERIKSKFGFQEFHLDSLAAHSVAPENQSADYYIHGLGTKSYTFFDTKYLIKGVEYFRPFIRGFIVLLLIFFNWRQYLSFIGHDAGMLAFSSAKADKSEGG